MVFFPFLLLGCVCVCVCVCVYTHVNKHVYMLFCFFASYIKALETCCLPRWGEIPPSAILPSTSLFPSEPFLFPKSFWLQQLE